MSGAIDVAFVVVPGLSSTTSPVQGIGPSVIFDASGSTRAIVAFGLVLLLGGLLLWRDESFVDRSIDASMGRPLSSLCYGVATHAVIVFAGLYLSDQLSQIDALGASAGTIGVLAGLLLVFLASALGFTVVGSTVVAVGWGRRPWYGLALGACMAGVAGFLGFLHGGLLWFIVVSMGIGGPARRWLHAAEGVDR